MGEYIKLEDCWSAAHYAAIRIRTDYPSAKTVYVLGSTGLVDELEQNGFKCIGGPSNDHIPCTPESLMAAVPGIQNASIDGFVMGFDAHFSNYKVAMAGIVFQYHPNAFFITTNDDSHDDIYGHRLPANGTALVMVKSFCAVMPTVLGKPNRDFGLAALQDQLPDRTLVIGDRIDTDMDLAKNMGVDSCLVLTGCVSSTIEAKSLGYHGPVIQSLASLVS